MAYTLSTGERNAAVDAHSSRVYDSAILELRTGAPPGPNAAATGTLVAAMTLPANAHAAASGGTAALAGTWQDSAADAAGTVGHFRIRQSGDGNGSSTTAVRVEGTVTATGGGGDMTMQNTAVEVGQQITVTAWPVTQPAS